MSRDEDLYRELVEREERDEALFERATKRKCDMKAIPLPPRAPDADKARERYNREILPVLEARRRLAEGKPATNNPLVNLFLKVMGRDKLDELPPEEIVERSKGFGLVGPSVEDIQKEIAANPEKFKDFTRHAPEVRPVQATRRTPDDLIQESLSRGGDDV